MIAQDPILPVTLIRVSQPPRLAWYISETTGEAFMLPHKPAIVTIFPHALILQPGRQCANFALITAPRFSGRWPFQVTLGGRSLRRGSIATQQTILISVPLPRSTTPLHLKVAVDGQAPYGGQLLSARFADFSVAACPQTAAGG